MLKEITRTVKFEIYPIGEKENIKSFYDFFNTTLQAQKTAMQNTYNFLMQREVIKENICKLDEVFNEECSKIENDISKLYESIKGLESTNSKYIKTKIQIDSKYKKLNKLKNEKRKESETTLNQALGYKGQTQTSKLAKLKNELDIPYLAYLDVGMYYANQDFSNDFIDLYQGKRAPRVYKSSDLLRLHKTHLKSSSSTIMIYKDKNKYYWKWHKWTMKINLGTKPSTTGDKRHTLDNIINGNYDMGMGSVQRKGNKLYLIIPIKHEVHEPILDKNRILGIDLGMDVPAYGVFNFNTDWGKQFGNKKELLDFKTRIKALKDREKAKMVFARGGHGRKRKLKNNRLDALKNREANFSKTYNHTLSKQIINHALKYNCGTIRMEKLSSGGLDGNTLGNWTYYQLQTFIQQKAERYGIEVELIPPKNTSKTCSKCGYLKSEFKLGNRDGKDGRQFHCPQCGLKINCDKNAAINIVNGGVQ